MVIINHAVIYQCKRNLAIVYIGTPGDTWFAEASKLVSLRLETQADRTLHVRECGIQHGRRD
jgi:hypothetical protein